jgi:hypothetical protein
LNYVISEDQLAVAPDDLFSANQIVHLRPLTGAKVYEQFIAANAFVRFYYPNFRARTLDTSSSISGSGAWSKACSTYPGRRSTNDSVVLPTAGIYAGAQVPGNHTIRCGSTPNVSSCTRRAIVEA